MAHEKLQPKDRDQIGAMFIVTMRMAERWLEMLELSYQHEYQASNDYKTFVKHYGKAYADDQVKKYCSRILRGDEKLQIGRLLKTANDFHTQMERIFNYGITHGKEDVGTNMDALQDDVNMMCYLMALVNNIPSDDDVLKLISTAKLYQAGNDRINERIMQRVTEAMR